LGVQRVFLWEDEMIMEGGRCKCGKLSLVSIFMIFDILGFWKLIKEGMEAILKEKKKCNTTHGNHVSFSLYRTNAVSTLGVNSNKNQSIKEGVF